LTHKILVLAVFALTYAFVILLCRRKTIVVWAGVAVLLILRLLSPWQAWEAIDWNVVFLYFGMLAVSEVFLFSKMPDFLATALAGWAGRVGTAMVALCLLSGFISILLENVAVVLLMGPIALATARKCEISPAPLLIGIAVSSNLQGAATLIGDPPSMLLAGHAGLSFTDFFFYDERPGLFFATQMGMLAGAIVLFLLFRPYRRNMPVIGREAYLTPTPMIIVLLLVISLVLASSIQHDFEHLTGLLCLFFGMASLAWFAWYRNGDGVIGFVRNLDWQTGVFLIGIFILVESLTAAGLIEDLAGGILRISGGSPFKVYLIFVWVSVALSALIDNVPFLVAMLPVAQMVSERVGVDPYVMYLGLLLGVCVGGNITPIGASANIVAMSMVRKHGHSVTLREFLRIGLPFSIFSVLASTLFGWLVFNSH
jgi:Na+/H+ antiporter NhaD/arsenite permease-like protein